MKKLLLLFLLIPAVCYAWGVLPLGGGVAVEEDSETAIAYLKAEQYYNTSYLLDEITSNDSSIFNVSGYADASFTTGSDGNGILFPDSGAPYIVFSSSTVGVDYTTGSFSVDIIPSWTGDPTNNMYIFQFDYSPVFKAYINTSGILYFYYGGTPLSYDMTAIFESGTPISLVFTWEDTGAAATVFLYVDGVQRATKTDANQQTAIDASPRIGNQGAGDSFYGVLDEIKIYDTAIVP